MEDKDIGKMIEIASGNTLELLEDEMHTISKKNPRRISILENELSFIDSL